jgi:hypothetical protein
LSAGGLTEAQLAEEFGYSKPAPSIPNSPRQTIAWWQERQTELTRKREKMSSDSSGSDSSGSSSPAGSPVASPAGSIKRRVGGKASPAGSPPLSPAGTGAKGGSAKVRVLVNGNGFKAGGAAAAGSGNGNGNGNGAKKRSAAAAPAPAGSSIEGVTTKVKELLGAFAGRR